VGLPSQQWCSATTGGSKNQLGSGQRYHGHGVAQYAHNSGRAPARSYNPQFEGKPKTPDDGCTGANLMFFSLFLISFSCRVFVARFTCFRLPTAMTV
jgi:hypothetical protein